MNTNNLQELYRTLDLEPGATLADLKRCYRELVKVWHPDRFAHDPALERKAQEKLKQINFAFELLQTHFAKEETTTKPAPERPKSKVPSGNELFVQGQNLFYGKGVVKDAAKAIPFLRKSAEMGFAPAQFLLGHAYYTSEGLSKSVNDAAYWWIKAAEQLHAGAQYSLGLMYHRGHGAGILAKVVKRTVDWQIGDTKIEAYKWLNLAITYGAGRQAGIVKQNVSTCLTEKQRNEARSRAAALYPKYRRASSDEIFDQLVNWFFEEGNSPEHIEMRRYYSSWQSKTDDLNKFRVDIREQGLKQLKNTFLGDTLTKIGGSFKTIGSNWKLNRSPEDWGVLIGQNVIEFPYDYLSNTFIQRRENAINQIWLNLMHR
jgi:TPR repeat protein